jgi:hypothetical protein
MITVSTRDERQRPATRSCAHDTEEDDPPAVPAEGLGLALPMLIAFGELCLDDLCERGGQHELPPAGPLEGRHGPGGGDGMVYVKPERSLYARGQGRPIN